jgi:hypothetical protein
MGFPNIYMGENLQQRALSCAALQTIRAPLIYKIITEGSRVFAKDQIAQSIDLLQLFFEVLNKLSTLQLCFFAFLFCFSHLFQ